MSSKSDYSIIGLNSWLVLKIVRVEFKLTPTKFRILQALHSHTHPDQLKPSPNFAYLLNNVCHSSQLLQVYIRQLLYVGFIKCSREHGFFVHCRLYGLTSKGRKVLNRYSELMEQMYVENYRQATDTRTPELDRSTLLKMLKDNDSAI